MERMFLSALAICGIVVGTYAAHASIIYAQKEIPTPPAITSPSTIQLRGTVRSISTTDHLINVEVVDPFNLSSVMHINAEYGATTMVRAPNGAVGNAELLSSESFPAGTNIFISIARRTGPVYIHRISAPTYL